MTLALARIDDRFIHGQVSVGWSRKLRADHIILCNDEINGDPWQRRVYSSTVAPPVKVSVVDRSGAAELLSAPAADIGERVILLVGGPVDMLDLVRRGVEIAEVNVGGMHYARDKREMLEFVYVDRTDLTALRRLLSAGVGLCAQQVPGSRTWRIDEQMLAEVEENL